MNPVRVLQMTGSLGYAGIESVIMNLYRNIDRSKVQFDFIVCSEASGRFDEEVEQMGGKIYRFPSRSKHPFQYHKKLKKFLKFHPEYRIFHCNVNSASGFVDIHAAKCAKVKVRILHSHNNDCMVQWQHKIFKPLLENVVTDKFSCSLEAAKWMFRNCENVNIIKNCVDLDVFGYNRDTRNEVRKKLGVESRFIIGHVGSFQERKNQAFLIDCFKDLNVNGKELWLIGEGETKASLIKLVNDLGLREQVKFLGNRADTHRLLQAMDVFAFPSKFEGLGVALIEAQASGLKCIVSDAIVAESKVTDNFYVADLNDKQRWISLMESFQSYERVKTDEQITAAGYDIKHEARRLTDFYLKSLER